MLSNQVCNPTARGTQTVGRISTDKASDLIMRHCCSSKQVHLLRFLPRTTTQALAAKVDARTEEAHCSLNSVPKLDMWRKTAARMPLRFGRLRIRALSDTMATAHKGALTQAEPHIRQSAGEEFADLHNSLSAALTATNFNPTDINAHATHRVQKAVTETSGAATAVCAK